MPVLDEPVHLAEAQAGWPQQFACERQRLQAVLEDAGALIEHIGSTAVPGLLAKPVVDIMIGLPSYPPAPTLLAALQALGYESLGEAGVPGRTHLRRRGPQAFNLHLVEQHRAHWHSNLVLRDWLRRSDAARLRYAQAKRQAVAGGATTLLAYSAAKADVVAALITEALQAGGGVAAADSATLYDEQAQAYLQARDGSRIGATELARWAATLRPGAEVLELGCGGGWPITRTLQAAGLRLWAVDGSPRLLAVFQHRFPGVPVQCSAVQQGGWFDRRFDAVVAVGLVFLLPAAEQAALLAQVARHLVAGGRLLFSAPVEAGQWQDRCTGARCQSLGRAAYEAALHSAGLAVVDRWLDDGGNHHFDTMRVPCSN